MNLLLLSFLTLYSISVFSKVTPSEPPMCSYEVGAPINSDLPSTAKEIADRLADNWYRPTMAYALPCPDRWATFCGELKDADNYTILQDHVYDSYYLGDFEEGFFSKVKRSGCVCFVAYCGPDMSRRNTFISVQSVSQCNREQKQSFEARKLEAIRRSQGRR